MNVLLIWGHMSILTDLLNAFDSSILEFVNSFARRSWLFDHAVSAFEGETLFKGGVLTAFLWWAWFRESVREESDRVILIAGTFSAIISLGICRILAFCLPFRERPAFVPALHFQRPLGIDPTTLINWSSFPSDHAGLFISLATTLFFVSKRAGIAAGLYTFLFICFPRVYAGDHYPSDIVVGAAIGMVITYLLLRTTIRNLVANGPLRFSKTRPALFYLTAYVGSLLLTTNFDVIRRVGAVMFRSLRTKSGM